MNILSNILNSNSYWTKCSSALCSIAMTEMGVRTVIDITHSKKEDLSADLSGTIFFAICASNIVPGFARIGGFVFTTYSMCYSMCTDPSESNAYWSSKAVCFPFKKTFDFLKFVQNSLDIDNHYTWCGVAVLITVIGLYALGKNIFSQPNTPIPETLIQP